MERSKIDAYFGRVAIGVPKRQAAIRRPEVYGAKKTHEVKLTITPPLLAAMRAPLSPPDPVIDGSPTNITTTGPQTRRLDAVVALPAGRDRPEVRVAVVPRGTDFSDVVRGVGT